MAKPTSFLQGNTKDQTKTSISCLVEYTIQLDEREWEDFAENPHDGHIVLHGLFVGINLLGWDKDEPKNSFTVLASDGDHYDEMMEAWNDFCANKKETV